MRIQKKSSSSIKTATNMIQGFYTTGRLVKKPGANHQTNKCRYDKCIKKQIIYLSLIYDALFSQNMFKIFCIYASNGTKFLNLNVLFNTKVSKIGGKPFFK